MTMVEHANGVEQGFKHESRFFRDLSVINFVQNHIRNKFPQGTHIADFACSQGQEAHSLAMLLSDLNHDKKYKITGYDIIPSAIEIAKKGFFVVENNKSESILFTKPPSQTSTGIHFFGSGAFALILNNLPTQTKSIIEVPEEQAQKIKKCFNDHFSTPAMTKKEIKEFLKKNFPNNKKPSDDYHIVVADRSKFANVLDFQVGDIRQAGQILNGNKPGAILFNNALYHISGAQRDDYLIARPSAARDVFNQIYSALPDNGIFSMGRLSVDHLQPSYLHDTEEIIQNGQKIRVCQNTPIHKELRNAGLEPIFYEKGSLHDSYVPAVWKKA